MKYVVLAARLLIGAIFVYASFHKILDPADFAQSIRNYQMIPPELSNPAAIVLPWVELIVGVFLILGFQTRPSAMITTVLLAIFLTGLYRAYFIGLDISCGCFSSGASASGKIDLFTLARDSALLAVSLFVLIADRGGMRILAGKEAHA